MAITPPTDIVLGVANAVDPREYQAAVERLRSLRAAPAGGFEVAEVRRAAAEPEAASGRGATASPGPSPTGQKAQVQSRLDNFGQLEAFVLQTFIQSMLPKSASSYFGKGVTGDIWRSMLAEKLATELALSGQIGLAKRLAQGSSAPTPGASAVSPISSDGAQLRAPSLPYARAQPDAVDAVGAGTSLDAPSSSDRS